MSTWDPPPKRDWPEPDRGRYETPPEQPPDQEESPYPPQSPAYEGQPGYDPLGERPARYDPLGEQPPGYDPLGERQGGYDPLAGFPPAPAYPAEPGYPSAPAYSPPPSYSGQAYDPRGYDTVRYDQQYPPPFQGVEPDLYRQAEYPAAGSYPGYGQPAGEDPFADDQTRFMPPLEPPRQEPPPLLGPSPLDQQPPDPQPLESPVPERPSFEPEVAPPVQRPPGRAGRNLPAAIAVGVGLAALVLVSLYLYRVVFVGVAVVAIVLAVWELSNALASRQIRPPVVPLVVGSVAMLVGAYAGGAEALAVATALTVLGVMMWRLPDGAEGYLRDMTAGVFAALYVPFLTGFAILMLLPEDGDRRVTVFILVTVCSDIGGYAAGVLFGRHPMAPAISPKKSWEGFAGSVLACTAGGALSMQLLLGGSWWQGVILGVATVLTATLGDLGESMIKRDLGIKDMGSLLPGHGGLMDRLDSLLPTAPIVWLLLSVFVPAT